MRKILIGAAGLVAAAATTFGASAPAFAAGAAEVPGTEENTYVRVAQDVVDGGGQHFNVSALYKETYHTASGNIRVGLTVRINGTGIDLDNDGPGDGEGLDADITVVQGYADGHTKTIQHKVLDGASDPITVDVDNPLNRPFKTYVLVSAGTNNDGFKNSAPAKLVQPVIGDEDPGPDGEGTETP
jgi:hypothetical protein